MLRATSNNRFGDENLVLELNFSGIDFRSNSVIEQEI